MPKKTDQEIATEIMEAGWGHSYQPGLITTAAHWGAKQLGKAAIAAGKAGIRAAGDAYYSDPKVQQKQHAKIRNDVIEKISRDFDHWSTRMTGATNTPTTADNVAQFIHDTYGIDASALVAAGKQAEAPAQAAPAPQAGVSPAPKVAGSTPWGKAAEAPHSPTTAAPAAPDAPVAAATDAKPAPGARAKKPVEAPSMEPTAPYKHDSSGIDFNDPHLQPSKPLKKKKVESARRSYTQIVNERLMDDAKGEAQAMVFGLARRVLSSPQSAMAFLQNNTVMAGPAGAPAGDTQAAAPKAPKAAAPKAAPAKPQDPEPAASQDDGDAAMKAKLNDIIMNQLHMKIDSSVVQGVLDKLKDTKNLDADTAAEIIDSPSEIDTARAIMLAVILATEK